MIVGQKRAGADRGKKRGGHFSHPVRNGAWNRGLGVIVGQPRRIAPFLTHDLRWIPWWGMLTPLAPRVSPRLAGLVVRDRVRVGPAGHELVKPGLHGLDRLRPEPENPGPRVLVEPLVGDHQGG
jgi:hypothetical protein